MTELIQQLLNEKFANYQQYHIFILILAIIVMALIQFFSNRHLKRDVTRLAATLKKSEIKFSRYHEEQVEAYKKLYTLFYEFRSASLRILYFGDRDADHHIHKQKLQGYIDAQHKLMHYFRSNRILFPKETCDKIDENFKVFSGFTTIIFKDKEDMDNFEMYFDSNFVEMYGSAEGEMDKIKQRARKLRESNEYKMAGKKIWALIQELEVDFRKLVE